MTVDMRTYKLEPGLRPRMPEVLGATTDPTQANPGMKILGPCISVEEQDTLRVMRHFPRPVSP